MSFSIGIIGSGVIMREQHLPALGDLADFTLVATADPLTAGRDGIAHFSSLGEMLASGIAIDCVAICTPPQARASLALEAINAGKAVLLEKPPAASLSQAIMLRDAAAQAGVTLFATWHSREAAWVAKAREWLAHRTIHKVTISWREDVRQWHPGQKWIWQAGGMGVFDPGINALSILTAILPQPVAMTRARLEIPGNCQTPIAARLEMQAQSGAPIHADFDFRQEGEQTWRIEVESDAGNLILDHGGATLTLPAGAPMRANDGEYLALYRRFAQLLRDKQSDCDLAPLTLVADAFLLGERAATDDFFD